ncbi:MAG: DUF4372 domain-containing protein [Burkholderiales bacterium]|nr:DUF4372 domain-containing protein [Burkholderiales bacterium]
MHAGKLVFAQVMEFAPWHTFRRVVAKYQGDFNVRSFSCLDQFLCLAFAQLTYRESLRDIEACLRAQPGKLYHLGLRGNISRSALADANEERDWRIYYEFAQALIRIARPLYAGESIGVDISRGNGVKSCRGNGVKSCLLPASPRGRRHRVEISAFCASTSFLLRRASTEQGGRRGRSQWAHCKNSRRALRLRGRVAERPVTEPALPVRYCLKTTRRPDPACTPGEPDQAPAAPTGPGQREAHPVRFASIPGAPGCAGRRRPHRRRRRPPRYFAATPASLSTFA